MEIELLNRLKRQAGEAAVRFVESGMIIGLGHGSTAIWALRLLAARVRQGLLQQITVVPCSAQVTADARQAGLPIADFNKVPVIDLTIDGADQVDPRLNLIKGAGGALLREKIIAQASRREIIVVDSSKLVNELGTGCRLPVEIVPFGLAAQLRFLAALGGDVQLRRHGNGALFQSDEGNRIVDCDFGPLPPPRLRSLTAALANRAGIVEHGLFLGLATDLIVAEPQGIYHQIGTSRQEITN